MPDTNREPGKTDAPRSKLEREALAAIIAGKAMRDAAQAQYDRNLAYYNVLMAVRNGAATFRKSTNSEQRGFLVRNFALMDDMRTYMFDGFHAPEFSNDPQIACALPPALQGRISECRTCPCPERECDEAKAPVVGVASYNLTGYHGAPSSVTFYVLCVACHTATALACGRPYEES